MKKVTRFYSGCKIVAGFRGEADVEDRKNVAVVCLSGFRDRGREVCGAAREVTP